MGSVEEVKEGYVQSFVTGGIWDPDFLL
ncbi:hypothetical protein A2U01_0108152, partial [Trifolium medium]|nr:hypothetical protein [Trifolium medium]